MTASNPRKTEADALYRKKKYGEGHSLQRRLETRTE